jgi:hypothetical protein
LNRAKKTKQYLLGQLEIFKGYVDLGDSKDEFFSAIRKFRDTTVSYLRKTGIINQDDLDKFDNILANIDTKKSKGVNNKVYWSGVRSEYDKAKSMLNEFILNMDGTQVPLSIICKDFGKDLFTQKSVIYIILSVVSFVVIALLTGLAKWFFSYLISLFKGM